MVFRLCLCTTVCLADICIGGWGHWDSPACQKCWLRQLCTPKMRQPKRLQFLLDMLYVVWACHLFLHVSLHLYHKWEGVKDWERETESQVYVFCAREKKRASERNKWTKQTLPTLTLSIPLSLFSSLSFFSPLSRKDKSANELLDYSQIQTGFERKRWQA